MLDGPGFANMFLEQPRRMDQCYQLYFRVGGLTNNFIFLISLYFLHFFILNTYYYYKILLKKNFKYTKSKETTKMNLLVSIAQLQLFSIFCQSYFIYAYPNFVFSGVLCFILFHFLATPHRLWDLRSPIEPGSQ